VIQKNSIGDVQPLSERFVAQIRELKTPFLPRFLSFCIIKIVVYFALSNIFTCMAGKVHGVWSDLT